MWFKNLFTYRMTAQWPFDTAVLEEALAANAQAPIGATQAVSNGWEPVFDGMFAHVVERQILLQFKTEKKSVPSSAIKALVAEEVAKILDTTGRKPGKKERRALTEDALLALLPRAIPTVSQTRVWIDRANGWIVVNTGSQAMADAVITNLVKSLDKLQLQTLYVAKSPASVMTTWLADEDGPRTFSIDRACVLTACDESKAVVKYTNSTLDTDNLREHLRQGKVCKELALTWEDRISFVLTDKFRIKKIKALDLLMEERADSKDEREAFDTDFVLMTSELNAMLNALVEAFGGEPPRETATEENKDLF